MGILSLPALFGEYSNRRSQFRHPLYDHRPIQGQIRTSDNAVVLFSLIDISTGGLGVWASDAIDEGETIELIIDHNIRVSGQVRWAVAVDEDFGYRIGVMLEDR
jgi:c-di-GMP-binding flagellar brake protein YcgR